MTLKQRLDLAIKALGLSGRALERECGLTNGSYSSIGNGVGADKLRKILFKFPQISADWVLLEKGEMIKTSDLSSDDGDSLRVFSGTEERRGPVFRLTDMLSDHQQNVSRLLSELERNGQRCDRILNIVEGGNPLRSAAAH